jgi:hypothetical protein
MAGLDRIHHRRAERPQRLQRLFACLLVAAPACDDARDRIAVGAVHQARIGGQLVRRRGHEVTIEGQHLACLVPRMNQQPAKHGADRIGRVGKADHDAEIATATTQAPEQIVVVGRAGRKKPAVGGDDLEGDHIVAGKPVLRTSQPTPPPSVSPAIPVLETTPTGTVSPCAWVAWSRSARVHRLGLHDARIRIHLDIAHRREIDHQAVIAERPAANIVAAATHCQQDVVVAAERDRFDHVVGAGAARDEARVPVDAGVPNAAGDLVVRVPGRDRLPFQARRECCGRVLRNRLPLGALQRSGHCILPSPLRGAS